MKRQRWNFLCASAAVAVFWIVRSVYWHSVEELPFSDMGNFEWTARSILRDFDFGWDFFWRSYTTPTLVALRALQIAVSGESLLAWRIFQAALTCAGMLWLAYELKVTTRSMLLPLAFLWITALSKSSVFWSLKVSREGVAEAFFYLCAAACISALRTRARRRCFFAGMLVIAAILNRANTVFFAPFFGAALLAPAAVGGRREFRRSAACTGLFIAGLLVLWTPWIVRSYRIYGTPVVLSTQGPYSFLWELGHVPAPEGDAVQRMVNVNDLQAEAPHRFKNDYEAYGYANLVVRRWMRDHWREYPGMVWRRFLRTIEDRGICLTKVPRDMLLPGAWNGILLDKTPLLIWMGILGLLLMPFVVTPLLAPISGLVFLTWLSAVLVMGLPRMLEAALPLLLFGAVVLVYALTAPLCRVLMGHASPPKSLDSEPV